MNVEFRQLRAPLGVQLELTPFCQNNCLHCYNYWRDKSAQQRVMSKEEFLAVVDDLYRNEVFYATVTGGEPLLNPALFIPVLERLFERGIHCDLNSNLVSVSDEVIAAMKRCGLISVLTSVHSFKEEVHDSISENPGSFVATMSNIERLAMEGFSVNVNMVITKNNSGDVYETCRAVKKIGARSFNTTRMQDPVRGIDFSFLKLTKQEVETVLGQLVSAGKDFGIAVGSVVPYPFCFLGDRADFLSIPRRMCGAGITVASIEYSGSVRACPNSEVTYGNVLLDGISECWRRMNLWRTGEYIPLECSGCYYLSSCKGGCRAEGMKSGNLNQPDPLMCQPLHSQIQEMLPFFTAKYFLDDEFVVCDRMRQRKEDFGYVAVGQKPTFPAFISAVVVDTLVEMKKRDKFSVRDILAYWKVDLSAAKTILCYLEERGIIVRFPKTERG